MTIPHDTALITGASAGIGEATARHFASQGIKVALAARSSDKLERVVSQIREAGGEAIAVPLDVANHAACANAVEKTVSAFGSLQILINNAGVIDPIAHLSDSDPESWGYAIDVNVKGVYHMMRAASTIMKDAGKGIIINISSGAATSALEGWSHYCASKAAALMLTRMGHKELAQYGIRTLGLSPGTVATNMQKEIKASGINPVSQLEWETHIPADWVARALAWMTTDEAKEFDGGDVSLRDGKIRQKAGITRQ